MISLVIIVPLPIINSQEAEASSVWVKLAGCESGNNPRAVSNTSPAYYGLYQFSQRTWKSVGGKGAPHRASRAQQTYRAKKLQKRDGWGAWPYCSRKLGLR